MSKQVNKNSRKPVPIDEGIHQLVKIQAAKLGMTIKSLVEGYIAEGLKEETTQNSP